MNEQKLFITLNNDELNDYIIINYELVSYAQLVTS